MSSPALARRLGLGDAVALGLGSMVGAGVFAVWAPAAEAAGGALLVGLAVAALVALCNATASAQLAAAHPVAGGTYAYGRAELGPWWGFVAGWGFIVGKTASCAAMALTFAAYAAPAGWERPVAIVAVLALTTTNLLGVTRTALLTRIIVVVALAGLAVAVAAGFAAPRADAAPGAVTVDVYGVLQSAGLLFFAFAGYARIATMGEEVRDPRRTIPRAIALTFIIAVSVYAVVGASVLWALGPAGAAAAPQPVAAAAAAAGWAGTDAIVRVAASAASLGALLALVAGIGRTAFAMARGGDLPAGLAAVHPRTQVPHRAELAVAVVVIALIVTVDLRGAIGFSSFGVLVYYLVANVAAWRQSAEARRYPRVLQAVGMAGCTILAVTLPWQSVVAGIAVVAIGVAYRSVRTRRAERGPR